MHGVIVLVVEDNEHVRDLVSLALDHAGAIPIATRTAEGAVAMLDALKCHAVVTELSLPGQDGYWLLDEIRKRRGALGMSPVIALTDTRRRREAGFARYLDKPITAEAVVEAITAVLDHGPS
jgi:DNA-binding response OmpR family regulator